MKNVIKSTLARTSECPSLDALAEADLKPAIQGHLENCAFCRTELALFHEFEAAVPQPGETASVEWIVRELAQRNRANQASRGQSSPWDRVRGWLAMAIGPTPQRAIAMVAASLLIVVAGGVYWEQSRTSVPSTVSGGAVWRTGSFSAIAPAGEIARPPAELRWEKAEGASVYDVELMEVDRTVIWTARSAQTTVEIPANIGVQLKPGRAFQWRVIARNAAGNQISSTDSQSFHIAATNP